MTLFHENTIDKNQWQAVGSFRRQQFMNGDVLDERIGLLRQIKSLNGLSLASQPIEVRRKTGKYWINFWSANSCRAAHWFVEDLNRFHRGLPV